MDTGNKTLAQLSEEGKESRYVTIEVGSKLSGYTKDYLERLCRLNKVEFLLWNKDQYALELESLLKETQTILLSYEGITFLDKSGLTAPVEQVTPAPVIVSTEKNVAPNASLPPSERIPHFVENERLPMRESSREIFSFTGRAVVSDLRESPSDVKDKKVAVPVSESGLNEEVKKNPIERPAVLSNTTSEKFVPVVVLKPEVSSPRIAPSLAKEQTTNTEVPRVFVPVVRESRTTVGATDTHDEWDARLLGQPDILPKVEVTATASSPSAALIPEPPLSLYHPIQTSVDASLHHEDFPLFPQLIEKSSLAQAVVPENKPLIPDVVSIPPPLTSTVEQVVPMRSTPPSFPAVRISPQLPMVEQKNLPEISPEHHLTILEAHPLMKNLGFNVAFALVFLLPSFFLIKGTMTTNSPSIEMEANLGAVAASNVSSRQIDEAPEPVRETDTYLEFSDEVVATEGETPNSVLIQPIYKEGAGIVHEYTNAHLLNATSTVVQ